MLQEANKVGFELHYFPCISQVASLVGATYITFDPLAPFRRSTFRNRMVLVGQDDVIQLSIPVVGGRSVKCNYGDVRIDHTVCWQRDHFRTLQTVYGNSPFFFAYREELETLYAEKNDMLFEWNLRCMDWFLTKSKLKSMISFESGKGDVEHSSTGKFLPSNYSSNAFGPHLNYLQVFHERNNFRPNLSCLDLLFHLGPSTAQVILSQATKQKQIFDV